MRTLPGAIVYARLPRVEEEAMKDFPVGLCWGTIHRASLAETIELAGRHGFPTIAVSPHIHADSIADGTTK